MEFVRNGLERIMGQKDSIEPYLVGLYANALHNDGRDFPREVARTYKFNMSRFFSNAELTDPSLLPRYYKGEVSEKELGMYLNQEMPFLKSGEGELLYLNDFENTCIQSRK